MPVLLQHARHDVVVPGLVEHAWVTRPTAPGREILLPDGRGLLQLVRGGAATLVDATTGNSAPETSGVRGLMTHAVVRLAHEPGVRLGLQLHPSALASVGAAALVDSWTSVDDLLGADVVRTATEALDAGDDHVAVLALVDGLASRRIDDVPAAVRFREVLRDVDDRHGAVTVPELARYAEATVSDVFRWSQQLLGVPPDRYLSAVRFAVFVRRAVGPGPVEPEAVLQALRWYAAAGYPPREVERTAGVTPAELRQVEERIASLVGAPSV